MTDLKTNMAQALIDMSNPQVTNYTAAKDIVVFLCNTLKLLQLEGIRGRGR